MAYSIERVEAALPRLYALAQVTLTSEMYRPVHVLLGSTSAGRDPVDDASNNLTDLLQGGTAVGTGLNTKKGFAEAFAQAVAEDTGAF